MRKLALIVIPFVMLSLIWFAGCAKGGAEVIGGEGTVKYIEIEDGFYGIVGDDGQNYDPVNLGPQYHMDGMHISFQAKILKDQVGTHQWGTLIETTKIEITEGQYCG